MPLLATLFLAAASTATVPAPEAADIVVLARMAEKVGVKLDRGRDGAYRFSVVRLSGDPAVGSLSCPAAPGCLETVPLARADRKAPAACANDERSRLLAALADQRRQTAQ